MASENMTSKLADELLQMILAPSLTLPEERFLSSAADAFGQNDSVSSASALLVCKRWLRVATPLLYETVVIRSTGQSQALAEAFRQNPVFAEHVRNIRIEGAYASLGEVLQRCRKLSVLVILLRVYSDANIKSLCSALPMIDPNTVNLRDDGQIDNVKLRTTFLALCDAIPTWKNLTTFEFPYIAPGHGSVKIVPNVTRRDRLIDALIRSSSLRQISCDIPRLAHCDMEPERISHWHRLASIPSIKLQFRVCPKHPKENEAQRSILDSVSTQIRGRLAEIVSAHIPQSKATFEFIEYDELPDMPSAIEEQTAETIAALNSSPKGLAVSAATEQLWSIIIAYAAIPGYPDPPDVFFRNPFRSPPIEYNTTRKDISLVCKTFERLVRPIFFVFPLITRLAAFRLFREKILQTPTLGSQVCVLYLDGLFQAGKGLKDLCALIPYLTHLRHFVGSTARKSFISTQALALLAKAAGDTLRTITNLELRDDDDPHPITVLSSFQNLTFLDITYPHFLTPEGDLQPGSLPCLHELRIHESSQLLNTLSLVDMPRLRSVTFTKLSSPTVETFLQARGAGIEELEFKGLVNLTEVLSRLPDLQVLRWEPQSELVKDPRGLTEALGTSASHTRLRKLILKEVPEPRSGEKEQTIVINIIFSCLDLARFPGMREIQFESYSWPTEERTISKDFLSKTAVQIKQKYNIDVTDRTEKPWRPRVQKRR